MPEQRVASLENAMEELKSSMASMEMRLSSIEGSLSEAKDRLYGLPSGWRLFGTVTAATIVTLGICTAIAFAFMIAVEGDMR